MTEKREEFLKSLRKENATKEDESNLFYATKVESTRIENEKAMEAKAKKKEEAEQR